ncbi:Cell division protein FtsN [Serratia ficaria]|uniref:cell division protein FtsN n=1 Tax=Serratia ficaria TaxID=61651 RepID=UPI00217B0687|nr:cell division protein FtsN [Serratia ficaria]CAI1188656.1 Cell division protein FtsN [Serratia ficaria]CAI2005132.1 Cell division protein FtsN [Serratia ficaria]CAI2146363.1 Cell division protein FtsN [Serratia ficaria]CAI2490581.1 Cell division protein FtsN [Serratia ficaria]CAI2512351.1 Cell division protein FtsN [Serratia ficaria]
MAQKDYVSRGRAAGAKRKTPSRKKRSSPKVSKTVLALAAALLVIFIGGLYFITHNKPDDAPLLPAHTNRPGNGLPPKPEERWRYIKELENRQIGVQTPTEPTAGGEVNSKTQLTAEQRQLLEQMQADMQQRPTQLNEVPYNDPSQAAARSNSRQQQMQQQQMQQQQIQQPQVQQPQQVAQPRNPFNSGATTAPVQQHQPAAQPKPVAPPPTQVKQPEPKPQPKPEVKQETAKPESKQKWMVQCGSFRATDQAESVRARLAFEGIESRITAGGGWNRVVLGPYSSRAAADKTLSRLKGVGMSSCIPLSVGG